MVISIKKTNPPPTKHEIGEKGEEYSYNYLKKNGFSMLETNYRCRVGEVDLIAIKKNELHFIEVKTRTNRSYGDPFEAVTWHKKQRLFRTALYYLRQNPSKKNCARVFSVLSLGWKDKQVQIEFFPNAFELEGYDD